MSEEKKALKLPIDKILLGIAVVGFLVVSLLYIKETGILVMILKKLK